CGPCVPESATEQRPLRPQLLARKPPAASRRPAAILSIRVAILDAYCAPSTRVGSRRSKCHTHRRGRSSVREPHLLRTPSLREEERTCVRPHFDRGWRGPMRQVASERNHEAVCRLLQDARAHPALAARSINRG